MRPAVGHKGTGPNQKGFQEEINEAENVHRVLIGLHKSSLRGRTRESGVPDAHLRVDRNRAGQPLTQPWAVPQLGVGRQPGGGGGGRPPVDS